MEQASMASEQEKLGPYQDRYIIACNRPECDEMWASTDSTWVGKASMSKRHRFLTTKDLHWQWFNVLTFGLLPASLGGTTPTEALRKLEEMKAAALTYVSNIGGWSGNTGLFFHVFGHNSVN